MWEAFCEVVLNDRERNATSAEKARLEAAGNATEVNAELQYDDDANNVKPLVNNKYFQLELGLNLVFKHTFDVTHSTNYALISRLEY
jgi:hypothetical protein